MTTIDSGLWPTVGVDWMGRNDVCFQVEGSDIVHVTEIDSETGEARITVFASTHPEAEVIFRGTVNLRAHADDERRNEGR